MPKTILTLSALAALGLGACGNTDLERAGTGAAAGAAVGEIASDDPLTGAALGGAAGALSDDI